MAGVLKTQGENQTCKIRPKPGHYAGDAPSVIDNDISGNLPSAAVLWTARMLSAGCALSDYLRVKRADAQTARGAVGAYARRDRAVAVPVPWPTPYAGYLAKYHAKGGA